MITDKLTTTDHQDRTFLVVTVAAAYDDGAWCAHVCDPASPLAGLYAFADSLEGVRHAVAKTAWSAVLAGELDSFDLTAAALAGVHVVATTCDAYEREALAVAVANDAA